MRTAAFVLALSAAAAWGIGGIMLKKGTDVVSPTTILVVQYAVGLVAVGGWVLATGGIGAALDSIAKRWPILLGIVALQIAGYVFFVVALQHSGRGSLSTAAVVAIAAMYPALVAVLSGPILDQRVGWHQYVGVALIIAGVVVSQVR